MPSPPTLIDVSVTPRFAVPVAPVVPAARGRGRAAVTVLGARGRRRHREQHRRRRQHPDPPPAVLHAGNPRSTGRSVLSRSWISTAQRWNTSGPPPAGSSTSSHGSSTISSRWREATRSAQRAGGAGQIAGEALQGAGARRRVGMAPPHVLHVLPGHRQHDIGAGQVGGAELTAAVAVGPRADRDDGVAGAPAHRHALDHVRAAGLDHQRGNVFGEDRSGHHRARRVPRAQGDQMGHRAESRERRCAARRAPAILRA